MKTVNNECTILFYEENGSIIIDNIEVTKESRNKGIATKAMQDFIVEYGDKQIELHAYPQDNDTDIFRLVEFYEKFGFVVECGSESCGFEMIRK